MAGTKAGGLKTAATIREKYGANYWIELGRKGGKNGNTGGFASDKIGADGLTGRQRAIVAGRKGGTLSRRGPAKKKEVVADSKVSTLAD